MNSLEALIVLSSVEGLGIQLLRKLVSVFQSPEAIFELNEPRQLSEKAEIPLELAERIYEARLAIIPQKIIDECHQQGVRIVHYLDEEYPKNLSAIYDPPVLLYVKGKLLPEDRFALGIVGARRSSSYGIQVASRFSAELAEKGITIVSGLALGIDRAAHEGALRAKGRTLAVLGSGLDIVYPAENRRLFEMISEQGALISEFPLGTEPRPFNFPKRNRIIAGLSLGILVVEAGQRSGSLITARFGADEGREIYAIPGRIDNPYSSGTHRLIQQGAKLITTPEEIFEDLYPVLRSYCPQKDDEVPKESEHEEELSGEETAILSALNDEPSSPDFLAEKLAIDFNQILEILTRLEMSQKVKRLWGGTFIKTEVYLK